MGLQCLCQRDITLPCWGDFVRTQLLGPSLAFLSHEVSRGGGGGCCEDLNFYPVQAACWSSHYSQTRFWGSNKDTLSSQHFSFHTHRV